MPTEMNHSRNIPQIQPWIDQQEWLEVKRVMESTYLTESRATNEFENGIKELTNAKHAIAVSNGTVALYCILKALDIGLGDEVIVPDITFVATSNAVIMAGAKPIFATIQKETLDFDYSHLGSFVTNKTKVIMPVHLYGRSANIEELNIFAKKHSLIIVEDAAQAIGVKFDNQHVGAFGVAGAFSFYGNKTITCGEGGVITTNNDKIAEKCRRLKNHGRAQRGTFVHDDIGFNFSITEMQSAIGIAQLRKLPSIIERKREIYDTYKSQLSEISSLKMLPINPRCSPVHWFTSYYSATREELAQYLANHGVQTRLFFCPLHMQPCYFGWSDKNVDYSESKSAYSQGISLPSSYGLSDDDLHFIIETILSFYRS